MRRHVVPPLLLAVLVVAWLGGGAPATADAPPGAGIDGLRIAAPEDDGPHPGAETEWWYVNVMNPATGETFIATLQSAPFANSTSFCTTGSAPRPTPPA